MSWRCLLHLGFCPCAPRSDETGCWGECLSCGDRVGFVDRATLRKAADAQECGMCRAYAEELRQIGTRDGTIQAQNMIRIIQSSEMG